jgi:succinylglutamate desuccinylase
MSVGITKPSVHSPCPGVFVYQAPVAGKSVVVMGGVHGNEPCGVNAVNKLRQKLDAGELSLVAGTLTLIVANPYALEKKARFVSRNLNRLFKENAQEAPCDELRRAEELKPFLVGIDYLLDLHSASMTSPPFLLCDLQELEMADKLGIDFAVLGWGSLDTDATCGDTEAWARSHGACSFTLECGQHQDSSASAVGYATAIRFLNLTGTIETVKDLPLKAIKKLRLYHAEMLRDSAFSYSDTFPCFSPVASGDVIGVDQYKVHRASKDSYLVFPAQPCDVPLDTELYLLAVEEP